MAFWLIVSLRVCIVLRNFWPYGPSHKMYSLSHFVRYMKLRPYTIQYTIGKEIDILSLYFWDVFYTLPYIDAQ